MKRNRVYDTDTEAAVRQFQQRSRLRVTGIVDARTWTFLRERPRSLKSRIDG